MSTAKKLMLALVAACLLAPSAMALNVGTDYTRYDNRSNGLYDGVYGMDEDDEVEPGMATGDLWDLEGFFVSTTGAPGQEESILSMVGTYDFNDGQSGTVSGDIFIDVNNEAEFGEGAADFPPNHKYEYVLHLDWQNVEDSTLGSNGSFALYYIGAEINPLAFTTSTVAANSPESDPVSFVPENRSRSSVLVPVATNSFTYYEGVSLSDASRNSASGLHNVVQFDWDAITDAIDDITGGGNETFGLHFTMSCGNDLLIGDAGRTKTPPVPEPASMALLGIGVLGIAMRRRFTA